MSRQRKPQWWYSGFEKGWIQGVKHYLHCWNNTLANPFKYAYYLARFKWHRFCSRSYYRRRAWRIKLQKLFKR